MVLFDISVHFFPHHSPTYGQPVKYSKVRYTQHAWRMLQRVSCALGLRCLLGLSWNLYLYLLSNKVVSCTVFCWRCPNCVTGIPLDAILWMIVKHCVWFVYVWHENWIFPLCLLHCWKKWEGLGLCDDAHPILYFNWADLQPQVYSHLTSSQFSPPAKRIVS